MAKNREYFHDRVILLFLAINAFLVFAVTASLLLRLGGDSTAGYTRAYRSNLGLDAFPSGSVLDILSFIAFALIVFALQYFISRKIYHLRRDMSLIIIFMTTLTLVFTLVIGNSLLNLR